MNSPSCLFHDRCRGPATDNMRGVGEAFAEGGREGGREAC